MTTMANDEEHNNIGWNFDNSYAELPESFYSRQNPTPVRCPEWTLLNHTLADTLGLNHQALESEDGPEVLSGNRIPKGALPLAQAYAGHQFGHFTMLGDGRAILLGEQITPKGERFDVQLKGSGRTPYSRRGDGRAALGPMLREYIISEAMYALGIPTTRSLAVVTTGESVIRENVLPGAILTRIASSHLRVGTFEYASKFRPVGELKALADYTLQRHFPDADTSGNRYLALLRGVIGRQASLIAKWQLAGFIHGVMNTDNMALGGETIDYGPCAFMDTYDPETVFSSIDVHGRYAYGNQPQIAAWNLARFAETLLPLLHVNQEEAIRLAQSAIEEFAVQYRRNWVTGMRAKLGIFDEGTGDEELFDDLLRLMQRHHSDYTNTFLALTFDQRPQTELFGSEEYAAWQQRWQKRLEGQRESKDASKERMKNSNPSVIPRNHRVEEALDAAVTHADISVTKKLLAVLSDPFAHSPEQAEYAEPPVPNSCHYRTFCGT